MGLWLFRILRSNRRAQCPPPTNSPKPQAPLRPPISREPRNEQTKCPLFSPNFPAELRISIYEAVLGDRHRFMHVIPFDDESNRVGRRRCEDMACEGPTWQHKCFGTWLERRRSSRKRKFTFHSSDQILALLLSCHRIYLEAIHILYTANTFSLKGARGILAFNSVTPQPQWHQIRYLNVSTIFLTPQRYWPEHERFPPDNYCQWSTSCETLQNLRGLRSLHVEIIVWDTHEREDSTAVEDDALVSILEPLNHVSAPLFEIEVNIAIPETVLERLGKRTFTLVVKSRPYDRILFPL
ncbi:uncharacterized protein BDR25DRAFT_272402 [Lindgomyces ingoldianus]|uniref:Uncharacterized protein n=1 Tax=Lindgomyces ingoldianus TaxID=673940 RepID=A0ACB6QBB6_9PLEO|nr:uncharacterized protein BDR25DRAFT_272402 [Lindgomyces ingoldianus]KAF2463883.1 hypothetical protein BDR25DRAFT_272402 [Lindgomyces ingoldianus]